MASQVMSPAPSSTSTASQSRQSYLDSITMGIDKQQQNAQLQPTQQMKNQVSRITNDPIMSDILADTAMTTLREQKEGGRPSGPSIQANGDQASKIVDQNSPEALFGNASSKWANLAFAPSRLNR